MMVMGTKKEARMEDGFDVSKSDPKGFCGEISIEIHVH